MHEEDPRLGVVAEVGELGGVRACVHERRRNARCGEANGDLDELEAVGREDRRVAAGRERDRVGDAMDPVDERLERELPLALAQRELARGAGGGGPDPVGDRDREVRVRLAHRR